MRDDGVAVDVGVDAGMDVVFSTLSTASIPLLERVRVIREEYVGLYISACGPADAVDGADTGDAGSLGPNGLVDTAENDFLRRDLLVSGTTARLKTQR